MELDYDVSNSTDDPTWVPIIGVNASYTYYPTYAEVLAAYHAPNVFPVVMIESNYEFENNTGGPVTNALILRMQEYWTNLSGATGQVYGNHYTWTFASGWQSNLDTPGALEMPYLQNLFTSRAWYNLVPDQSNTVLTAGLGTKSSSGQVSANNYAVAARTPDGSLVMAYLPTVRTVTIAMTQLSGMVTSRWYDPSSGTYVAISGSPFANTGSRTFTPPGEQQRGRSGLGARPGGERGRSHGPRDHDASGQPDRDGRADRDVHGRGDRDRAPHVPVGDRGARRLDLDECRHGLLKLHELRDLSDPERPARPLRREQFRDLGDERGGDPDGDGGFGRPALPLAGRGSGLAPPGRVGLGHGRDLHGHRLAGRTSGARATSST